ncbi:MAG TPA: response regulator [Candidatus Dormibacteraeota bacterium]|nr:response regulator [Candidatus Dormibacteraeota bacterium]
MAPQPRVLMIEDHPEIVELYQLKLQLDGYRVAVASDGVSGLEMARGLLPDVVLLDIHLPQLDGLQLLNALRKDDETRGLAVVCFSEDDSPELIREAERLSADAYLLKSRLLPSGLSRTVAEVLRNHGPLSAELDAVEAAPAS